MLRLIRGNQECVAEIAIFHEEHQIGLQLDSGDTVNAAKQEDFGLVTIFQNIATHCDVEGLAGCRLDWAKERHILVHHKDIVRAWLSECRGVRDLRESLVFACFDQ